VVKCFAIDCNGAIVLNAKSKDHHSSKSAAAFDCAGTKNVSVEIECDQSRGRPFVSRLFAKVLGTYSKFQQACAVRNH
jgi:hypothetical protein